MKKMPAVFVSDFGPMPAFENDDYTRALEALGKNLPRPQSVVVMSGHWNTGHNPIAVTSAIIPETIHDYSGFPREFYEKDYPCPGNPDLAGEIVSSLKAAGFEAQVDSKRGLDHGAWVPLSRIYPQADIPVVQISVPAGESPRKIEAIGRSLSSLRNRDILILASGALAHNLRLVHFGEKQDPPDPWAVEFDAWLNPRIKSSALEDLKNYRQIAPHANLAAPTSEHFDPLFFALGAGEGEKIERRFHAIYYGNGLLLILTLGPL